MTDPMKLARLLEVAQAMHPESMLLVQLSNSRLAVTNLFWDVGEGALVLELGVPAEFVPAPAHAVEVH